MNYVKRVLAFILYYSGFITLLLKFERGKYALVFYGHKVSDDNIGFFKGINPREFEKALLYLGRHFSFISMDALVNTIRSGEDFRRRSMVLTFDDGFRDNYINAYPVLKQLGIPAIIYLVFDCIERGYLPWSQRLAFSFQTTRYESFVWHDPLGKRNEFKLTSPELRLEAYKAVKAEVSKLPYLMREEILSKIERDLDVEPIHDQMLTWSMVNEMKSNGIDFGAHTLTHPILYNMPVAEAVREISHSKTKIEERLAGNKVKHFIFPAASYNDQLLEEVAKSGYESCSVQSLGKGFRITPRTSPYRLVRLGIPNEPYYVIIAEASGVFNVFRRIFQ